MPAALQDYVIAMGPPFDDVQSDLVVETAERYPSAAGMQIGADQSALMTLVTRLVGARFAVEVGTFTGMSAIAIARGLADGGRLLCCDVSEEWTSVARRAWERAGLSDRIELRLAPALDTLRALPPEPAIDLVFLDADKTGYLAYWEELVPRVRPGGVLLVDNVFFHGGVLEETPSNQDAAAIKVFNERVRNDDRVDQVVLPVGDGVTLAVRR